MKMLVVLVLLLYVSVHVAAAEEEIITLKAPKVQRESALDQQVDSIREFRIQQTNDMAQRGYTLSPDRNFEGWELPASYSLEPLERFDGVLGFERMSFADTPFKNALSGVLAEPSPKDGKVHELHYVFDFEDLGRVTLLERSYATSPTIAVYRIGKPLGNLTVGGQEGSFLVERNPKGTKGKSSVFVTLNGKIFHMVSMTAYERESPEWYKFQDLALHFK